MYVYQHPDRHFCDGFYLGEIMRKLLFVLSVFVAGLAHARVLHVDDNVIKLSQTKTTDPALHVRVGDELWYANMGRCALPMNESTDKELKVKYNNTDYWVSDVEDYVIIDGKLIAANCNIYLESTGTQWIDTNCSAPNGFMAQMSLQVLKPQQSLNRAVPIVGAHEPTAPYKRNDLVHRSYFEIGADGVYNTNLYIDYTKKYEIEFSTIEKNLYFLNADLSLYNSKAGYERSINTLFLFSVNTYNWVNNFIGKIYFTKIYKNSVLVRHFVPVPCGLKIGDFVVPSNGMWDIVEQKFYGNMGTGDFIYGVDE